MATVPIGRMQASFQACGRGTYGESEPGSIGLVKCCCIVREGKEKGEGGGGGVSSRSAVSNNLSGHAVKCPITKQPFAEAGDAQHGF